MKEISSGLVITDGISFLGCKITGQNIYDIPKGKIDANESPLEACIREVKEETGLIMDGSKLVSFGLNKYTPKKDLYLFYLFVDKLPELNKLYCSSYFTHPKSGKEIPEINDYEYIKWMELNSYMGKSMILTLSKISNTYSKYFNEDGYLELLAKQK